MTENREPRKPTRTCVGCARHDDADAMIRVVLGPRETAETDAAPSSAVAVDFTGGASGRGAHVHARPECLAGACKGGLARSFKTKITAKPEELATQIVAGADRRMRGLVLAASRKHKVAAGADAACEALEQGAPLVIVAVDAGTVVGRRPIADAVAKGRAIAWLDKVSLGSLVGALEVAVMAVLDEPIAQELFRARATADAVGATIQRSGCIACRSEVR